MPWTNPNDPVPGTVITAAFAVANWIDQLRWLRQLLGGADPPGSNYVPLALSTTGVAWSRVPTDAIADAAITDAKLQNPKVNRLNPGQFGSFAAAATGQSGFFDVAGNASDAPVAGAQDWLLVQNRHFNQSFDYRWQLAVDFQNGDRIYSRLIVSGAATPWRQVWHSGINPTIPAIQAAPGGGLVQFQEAGGTGTWLLEPINTDFVIARSGAATFVRIGPTGVLTAPGVSSTGDLTAAGNVTGGSFGASGSISATAGVTCVGVNAQAGNVSASRLISTVAQGTAPLAVNSTTTVPGLSAERLGGFQASQAPAPGTIPVADAGGKLDAWVSPSAGVVPTGLIALWGGGTAPSGWVFETTYNGRFVIAAQAGTYPLGTTGGGTTHAHTSGPHAHGAAALSIGGSTAASTDVNGLAQPGGTNLNTTGHTHGAGTLDVGGATDGASATIDAATALPPYIALNYIRKT